MHVNSANSVHAGDIYNVHVLPQNLGLINAGIEGDEMNRYLGNAPAVIAGVLQTSPTIVTDVPAKKITAENLRNKMEKWYQKTVQLPQVSWMKKADSKNILKNYYITLKECETEEEIPFREIFQVPFKRLLIESEPGFGKTTLAMKMIHDWARKKEYLKEFDFAFFFQLRELRDCDVAEAMCGFINQLMNLSVDFDEIQQILMSKNVLLIMDGYDELQNDGMRDYVNDIMKGDKDEFEHFTVLTTSRTGTYETEQSKFGFESSFYQRRIAIAGLCENQVKTLLKQVLTDKDANQVYDEIEKIEKHLHDVCECPLFVILIAFLHTDQGKFEFAGTSKTEFYKKILTTLVKSPDQTISSFEEIFEKNLNTLQITKQDSLKFGKLALELIAETKFAFEDSKVVRKMYKAGFLTISENLSGEEMIFHYKPIHPSFAEFFAAYYLKEEIENSPNNLLSNERIEMLTQHFVHSEGTTLIHSFLLGLLGEQAYVFFDQLKPYAYVYSQMEHGFWNMIAECSKNGKLIDILVPFIPPSLANKNVEMYSQEIYTEVIRRGTQTNRFKRILWCPFLYEIKLPTDVCIDTIAMAINLDYLDVLEIPNLGVQCHKLIVAFFGNWKDDNTYLKLLMNHLKRILRLKFKTLSILVDDNSTCLMLNRSILKLDLLQEHEVESFHCSIKDQDKNWIGTVCSLIENYKLKSLYLMFEVPPSMEGLKWIMIYAGKSKNLTRLTLNNHTSSKLHIDLDDLIQKSKQRWDEISISRSQVCFEGPMPEYMEIKFLELSENDCNAQNIIVNSVIKSFACDFSFLLKIGEEKDLLSKPFANVLYEMIVRFDSVDIDRNSLSTFNQYGALRKIAIIQSAPRTALPEELADALKLLRIEHLEIWFDEENERTVANFISTFSLHLLCKNERSKNSVKTVILFALSGSFHQQEKMLVPLLKCLEDKRLKKVGIILDEDTKPIYYNWIDINKFMLNYRLAGTVEEDMECWKELSCDLSENFQIEITLR